MPQQASSHEIPKKASVVIVLAALACIASSPLSLQSWFDSGDHVLHLIRCNDVCYEMSIGNYYPRWLSQSCYGKGSPTLNFYAPGFYLLVGYLNVIGLPILTAIVAICTTSFFLSGWGMFLWTRKYCGEIGALIAAAMYMFAPYHFADIYVRGGLPEFIALAILPFLFHAVDLSFSPDRMFRGVVYTALASSAIVVTHNLSALMIAPFALAYFVWCSLHYKPVLRQLLLACTGPLFGAGLASFYWIPVVFETKYLLFLNKIITGPFYYADNFISPYTFLSSNGHAVYGYHHLYVVIFLSVAVSATHLFHAKGPVKGFGITCLVLCLISIFMTFAISGPIYRLIPAFQYVQFPWRFLGPATLFLAAFCGIVVNNGLLARNKKAALAICAAIVLSCVSLSGDLRTTGKPLPYFPSHPVSFSRDAYPIFFKWSESDYMPVYSRLYKRAFVDYPMLVTENKVTQLNNCWRKGSHLACTVDVNQITRLAAPWFYFPGWVARCDNMTIPTYADELGLVSVSVPPGQHYVEIDFGTTWPRVVGWISTGVSLASMLMMVAWKYYKRR